VEQEAAVGGQMPPEKSGKLAVPVDYVVAIANYLTLKQSPGMWILAKLKMKHC